MVWWSWNPEVWWLEISNMVRWVVLHVVPTSGRVYVWRTPKEAHNPECLVPNVKNGGRSIKIWAAVSWNSAGPLITMNGLIIANDYVDILGNRAHLMVQMLFPNNDAIIKDDSSPTHTQLKCSVLVWGAWRCTSTSSLASIIARLKYHGTTVVSCSVGCEAGSLLHHLSSNCKMFFTNSGTMFH